MRNSLFEIFSHSTLKGVREIVRSLFDNYIRLRYTGEEYFLMKFLNSLDDYTAGDILPETIISEKLGFKERFLNNFKRYEKGTHDKYFRFLISIDRINPLQFNFKDQSKFEAFVAEVEELAFNQLVTYKMVSNTKSKRMQFDAILSTLKGLTKIRYRDFGILQKYITRANPLGLYTLGQLSERISSEGNEHLLNQQLTSGRASVQLARITTELNKGIRSGIDECLDAKNKIKEYLKQEKLDSKNFGNVFHDIYERYAIEYLAYMGVKCTYETKVNYPESGHKVDNIIERSKAFKDNIEAFQNIIEFPKNIELITVDYTFTSDKEYIKEKFYKHYQEKDRFLIIVLLGEKSPKKILGLRQMLNDLQKKDDGSNNLNHIKILTSDEYIKFLAIPRLLADRALVDNLKVRDFLNQYESIKHWSLNIFNNKDMYDKALEYWELSLSYLSNTPVDWINSYLPQN